MLRMGFIDQIGPRLHHCGYVVHSRLSLAQTSALMDTVVDEAWPQEAVLKDNPHNLVAIIAVSEDQPQRAVVKIPRSRNRRIVREGLLSPVRGSASRRAAESLLRLKAAGFQAPDVLLLAERRWCGLVMESFFVQEFVEGRYPAGDDVALVVRAMEALHAAGYTRRDAQLRNFIIVDDQVVFIDVGVKRPLLWRRVRCHLEYRRFLRLTPEALACASPEVLTSFSFRLAGLLWFVHGATIGRLRRLRRWLKACCRKKQ